MSPQAVPPADEAGDSSTSALALVRSYEQHDVAGHPLLRELRERPLDLGVVWLLMVNLQTGISAHFIHWLAKTIDRVPDRRVASLVAKQLNDELGNGDFAQIHSVLLERFVTALAEHGARAPDARSLEPGRVLGQACSKLFCSDEPYEAVGALMVSEIFAKKMDQALADALRRPHAIPADAMTWLGIHEVLEASHADDSGELAALVPQGGPELAATWRGAQAQWRYLWNFLDAVRALASELREPTLLIRSDRA